jgi:aerobic-type carbon monoxide dehydrogenase small subunit (CoxS/CutS family)
LRRSPARLVLYYRTCSILMGRSRTRRPVAWKIALAIAGATPVIETSPRPFAPVLLKVVSGACTVHLDGRRIVSCLTLAVQVDGHETLTVEGLSGEGPLHPMQQAFIDHDALQCGYCTPGQIMAAVACVQEGHARSADEIREYMSGNVCRCGAYVGIVAAIQDAAVKMGRA